MLAIEVAHARPLLDGALLLAGAHVGIEQLLVRAKLGGLQPRYALQRADRILVLVGAQRIVCDLTVVAHRLRHVP